MCCFSLLQLPLSICSDSMVLPTESDWLHIMSKSQSTMEVKDLNIHKQKHYKNILCFSWVIYIESDFYVLLQMYISSRVWVSLISNNQT